MSEQIDYSNRRFRITLNYEQHLLLRMILEESLRITNKDKFDIDDLSEAIYDCEVIDIYKTKDDTEEIFNKIENILKTMQEKSKSS